MSERRSALARRALLLGGLALLACERASSRRSSSPESEPKTDVTLLSYNVNFGLAGDPEGLAAIAESGADIVLLQESNEEWEQALRADPRVASAWPQQRFHHCCGAGGLALLSRWPIEAYEILEPPDDPASWFPAARAVVTSPAGPLQLLNLHLRPPVPTGTETWVGALSQTPRVRVAEVEHFASALASALPTVIAGDFNEGDDGRALDWLADAGFEDSLAELPRRVKTWRWGSLRGRLDHVLVNARLRVQEIEVIEAGRSDHFPLRGKLLVVGGP